MLLKLTEDTCINPDYIINLYLKEHESKWIIVAKMIDATNLGLATFTSREDAEIEYAWIITEVNKHSN